MIALDAMGGDLAPRVAVHGAITVSRQGIPITLFGDETQLVSLLSQQEPSWQTLPLYIIHCSETIEMSDEPTRSVMKKKNASLIRAIQAVADGRASVVVSAGNSGACLVGGTLLLGRVKGISRPAIGNFLPTHNDSIFCIDLGANTDCKPEFLEQFALMGHVYVKMVKNIDYPRIALLSNGSEAYKGSLLTKEVYKRLEYSDFNFVGNVEARDIFNGQADILVSDGFTGNILLKTMQGTASAFNYWLKKESARSWLHTLYFRLGSNIFKQFKKKTDYTNRGGALLLGLNHPFVVAHGSSCNTAMESALQFAHHVVEDQFVFKFNKEVEDLALKRASVTAKVSQKLRSLFNIKRER